MFDIAKIDRPSAFRLAMRLTNNNRDKAEDLVQATMLRAWEQRERYHDQGLARGQLAWFGYLMRNIWINQVRRDKVRATVDLEVGPESGALGAGSSVIEARELMARLEGLQPAYRKALELRIEGYDYSEIANLTGVPIGTVMSRLYRARQAIGGEL